MNAVKVEGLKKSYSGREVLRGLSFSVEKGEIFALLGVNGAGKTTALECIEGVRRSDGGTVEVMGRKGIQLQSATLPSFIRPMEAVKLFAVWNKTRPDEKTLAALKIEELGKKNYAALSTGQKRRLHLALALTGDPDVVFLDEPTAGLDVEGRIKLHEQIRSLKKSGKSVILASHDMAEVETLCDRIAILKEGQTAFIGRVEELSARLGRRHNVSIKTSRGEDKFETDDVSAALLKKLGDYARQGVTVLDVRADRGTLEQHFINIAKGEEL